MHVMKRFILTLAAFTGLGIAPLIGQTPTLQTVPLSADIDVVNVRTLFRTSSSDFSYRSGKQKGCARRAGRPSIWARNPAAAWTG